MPGADQESARWPRSTEASALVTRFHARAMTRLSIATTEPIAISSGNNSWYNGPAELGSMYA